MDKLIEKLQQETEEYKLLTAQNKELLSKLGINTENLPSNVHKVLTTAVKYQQMCKLNNMTPHNIQLWYMQKLLEDAKMKPLLSNMKLDLAEVNKKLEEDTTKLTQINKVIEYQKSLGKNENSISDIKIQIADNRAKLLQQNFRVISGMENELNPQIYKQHIAELETLKSDYAKMLQMQDRIKFYSDIK